MKTYLAVDLGAGSGRVIAARFDGRALEMETVNRFENVPVELNGHIHWNIPSLLTDIRDGLAAAKAKHGDIACVGVDTWGVDYALMDKTGRMLGLPYAYRDARNTPENARQVFDRFGRKALYQATGIQFMDINTVFQLHAERQELDSLLPKASRLLFTPDLVNFELCGEMANEATIASTSQLIDVQTRDWCAPLLQKLDIPASLFSPPAKPGAMLGTLRAVPGMDGVPVAIVGAHDTASAVAAVPADPATSWGYLSTGTWALLGVETPEPILTDLSYELSYTHEGAVNGQFRYLKNCTGMWMVQELRRAWSEGGSAPDYETLMQQAVDAKPFRSFIDPDHPPFQSPGRMPEKIVEFCEATNQPAPETQGEFYRAAMEGIVMRYREVWGELEQLTGRKRNVLHMIGGATKDALHCQMTADALNIAITCGPAEGAAMGNALAQMVATGDLADFDQGRQLIRASIEPIHWEPKDPDVWHEAFPRWQAARAAAREG
ncbi:MAG: rhamnulokinase [Kiritimatiellia bacterium]|jgi:rhamnulokinase